jgi:predicted phage terminase large subunit-like protein
MNLPPSWAIKAELSKRNFYYFVREFWETIIPDEAVYNWHIEYLCNELQSIATRVKDRQPKEHDVIINIPPGTTKSTICTIMFPVWCWTIDPTLRFITGSYSSDLSTEHAVKSRDIIRSDKFKKYFGELELKSDKDNKTSYENNFTGSRSSTSVGGTVTGKHAHILIIDDPLNPKKSASEVERLNANEWFDKTLSTRKVDKAVTVTILIMQRLHENDCTGHILSKTDKKVKHICLPAEVSERVSPPELKEKYINGLLDVRRLSRDILNDMRIDLGSYGYSGQMAQSPSPDDGGIIKRDWFKYIDYADFVQKYSSVNWCTFIDPAYTSKSDNDPTALMSAVFIDNNLYIRESKQVWLEFPELIKEIKSFNAKNGFTSQSITYIEPKASGQSVIQQLRIESNLNISELEPPRDDKITRAHSVAPFIEGGRVVLVRGQWNESFISECMQFPNGQHDDQVDNLTASIKKYYLKPKIKKIF